MKFKLDSLFIYKRSWFFFLIIKVFYVFFTLFIYSKFVQLGDMQAYLNGVHYNPSKMFLSSTAFVGTISFVLSNIFGLIITSLIFMFFSFFGIYYSIKKMGLSGKYLIIILVLFSLPSFSVWTSIAGKEAVSVLFMGILFGYIMDYIKKVRFFNIIELVALYLGLLIKPQYIVPLIIFLIYFYFKNKLNLKILGDTLFLIIVVFFVSIMIYIYSEELNDLFYSIPKHFSLEANSTRQEKFWQEDFDFLYKLIEGIFLSFIGPSLYEVLNRLEMLPIFLESMFICFTLSYIIIKKIDLKINTFNFNILIFLVIGILILSYPLGVSNYMTAIRYREGYYVFIIEVIFYVFCIRNKLLRSKS
jgi:hypothetical protein